MPDTLKPVAAKPGAPKVDLEAWRQTQLDPWKKAMAAYLKEREDHMRALRRHAPQLQSIVALLMEGRPRQAMLAWNTLGMKPDLHDLRLSRDGEALTLIPTHGAAVTLTLDQLIDDLQALLAEEPPVTPSTVPAGGS